MKTPLSAGLIAGALAATGATSTAAHDARSEAAAAPATTATPLRTPRAGLLTGAQPGAGEWNVLAAGGVTTVINLRPDAEMAGRDEAGEVRAAGLRYASLPVAGPADITVENARELKRLIDAADGTVIVHCASGNRVGALLALAAADSGEMTPDEAIAFGRTAGLTGAEPRVREVLAQPASE